MEDKRCSKCGGAMVAGRVCESNVEFWSETQQTALAPKPRDQGRPMYPIVTYRCSGCGYLEWYAALNRPATKTEV